MAHALTIFLISLIVFCSTPQVCALGLETAGPTDPAIQTPALTSTSAIDYNGTIVQESVPFKNQLNFFKTRKGRLLGYIAKSKTASKLMGWAQNHKSPFSINWKKFVEKHNIDMEPFVIPEGGYKTFNEFFTRRLKTGTRPVDPDPSVVVSPADAKCTFVCDISQKDTFIIKSSQWSLERMLGSKLLAEFYEGGTLINFRLAPEDYHHFHFPFDAKASSSQKIAGSYNSVNPYIFKQGGDPLGENARNILVLKSENFCDPLFIIVGAMGVGKIIETYKPDILYKKGDDMGYFQFGASTVCMLFRKGVIKPGNDKLVTNSRNHIETAVKQGERIAIKANQEPQEISIFWLSFTELSTFFTRALQKLTHWF